MDFSMLAKWWLLREANQEEDWQIFFLNQKWINKFIRSNEQILAKLQLIKIKSLSQYLLKNLDSICVVKNVHSVQIPHYLTLPIHGRNKPMEINSGMNIL